MMQHVLPSSVLALRQYLRCPSRARRHRSGSSSFGVISWHFKVKGADGPASTGLEASSTSFLMMSSPSKSWQKAETQPAASVPALEEVGNRWIASLVHLHPYPHSVHIHLDRTVPLHVSKSSRFSFLLRIATKNCLVLGVRQVPCRHLGGI